MMGKLETADPCRERAPAQVELAQLLPPWFVQWLRVCKVAQRFVKWLRAPCGVREGALNEGVERGALNEERRGIK